ncbi:MAG: hypothetical protein J5852_08605, partial [Clostridia bacterium]|nr:hypothetical protein [Clostridia bacterium]
TLSISAMAEASPENKVIIRKGTGTKQDGSTVSADTWVEVAEDNTITVVADPKYGTFNSWSIYVVSEVTDTAAGTANGFGAASLVNLATKDKAATAVEGTDYEIVSGTLKTTTLTVRPISKIAICGNYSNTITDPLSDSSTPGTSTAPKTGDMNKVIYVSIAMLAAAAVVFTVKRQLSK